MKAERTTILSTKEMSLSHEKEEKIKYRKLIGTTCTEENKWKIRQGLSPSMDLPETDFH